MTAAQPSGSFSIIPHRHHSAIGYFKTDIHVSENPLEETVNMSHLRRAVKKILAFGKRCWAYREV